MMYWPNRMLNLRKSMLSRMRRGFPPSLLLIRIESLATVRILLALTRSLKIWRHLAKPLRMTSLKRADKDISLKISTTISKWKSVDIVNSTQACSAKIKALSPACSIAQARARKNTERQKMCLENWVDNLKWSSLLEWSSKLQLVPLSALQAMKLPSRTRIK